jgi:DNA-binding protein HU-beta
MSDKELKTGEDSNVIVKRKVASKIAAANNLKAEDAATILDSVLDTIKEEVKAGKKVVFRGFGSFENRKFASRLGVNFKTGGSVIIPERTIVKFKPSDIF